MVIASGGFGANVKLRMKYDTLWNGMLDDKFKTTNSPAITGDGILMGSVRISVSGEVIPGAAQRGCPLYLRCSMPDLMR